MSVDTGARLRVAVAAALVVAVVIALVARGSHHHPSAPPAPVAAPTATVTTVESPTAPGAGPAGATTTTVTAGTTAGRPSTGGRTAGPFANGTPAALAVPAGAPLDPLPPPDAGWSPLSVAQGTGNGANGTFTITSATTQVRFRSSAGQFHLFVVDQALGRDATAGYADVDCSAPCSDLQTLSVPKGTYHVEVDADGPWEYSVEQYR